jgi:hypothetical protein
MTKWVSRSKKRRKRPGAATVLPLSSDATRVVHAADVTANLDPSARKIAEIEHEVASQILGSGTREEQIIKAAGNALAFSDQFGRKHLTPVPGDHELACKHGCHWCCYLRVEATVPEVLAIAAFLQHTLAPQMLAGLRARIAQLAGDRRIFDVDAKPQNRIPCPLLGHDGSCTAYAVRPLACRGWNSMDAESCRRALDKDEPGMSDLALFEANLAIGLGLKQALADARLPTQTVELTSGLHIALTETEAVKRWASGEPLFAPAAIDGTGFHG